MIGKKSVNIKDVLRDLEAATMRLEEIKRLRDTTLVEMWKPHGHFNFNNGQIEFVQDNSSYSSQIDYSEISYTMNREEKHLVKLFGDLCYALNITNAWAAMRLALSIMNEYHLGQ